MHFWQDNGFGIFELAFIRDKDKREVDFVVIKNDKPWFMVEVKNSGNKSLSKSLVYFKKKLNIPHAFQVVFDTDYIGKNCFDFTDPIIVPAKTFLMQLI